MQYARCSMVHAEFGTSNTAHAVFTCTSTCTLAHAVWYMQHGTSSMAHCACATMHPSCLPSLKRSIHRLSVQTSPCVFPPTVQTVKTLQSLPHYHQPPRLNHSWLLTASPLPSCCILRYAVTSSSAVGRQGGKLGVMSLW